MIVRVTLASPSHIFDNDGKSKPIDPKYVDISADSLSWKIDQMGDGDWRQFFLVITNESEGRPEAMFAPNTWANIQVLDGDEAEDDEPSYVD